MGAVIVWKCYFCWCHFMNGYLWQFSFHQGKIIDFMCHFNLPGITLYQLLKDSFDFSWHCSKNLKFFLTTRRFWSPPPPFRRCVLRTRLKAELRRLNFPADPALPRKCCPLIWIRLWFLPDTFNYIPWIFDYVRLKLYVWLEFATGNS